MKAAKLKRVRAQRMRHFRHFQYFTVEKMLLGKYPAIAEKIAAQLAAFEARLADEDIALKVVAASYLSGQIKVCDRSRDELWRRLVTLVKLELKSKNAAKRTAAERAMLLVKTYGNAQLASLPYDEQSAALTNVVQDMKTILSADMGALGLTELVLELEAANGEFIALWAERIAEDVGKTKLKVPECRTATEAAHDAIMRRLEALIEIEGEEGYAALIDQHNRVVDKYTAAMAGTGSRPAADEGEGEEPPVDVSEVISD